LILFKELDPFSANTSFNSKSGKKSPFAPFKREVKFSQYNEKFKQFDFFERQTAMFLADKIEKINLLNNELNSKLNDYNNYFTRYEMITNISLYRNKNYHLNEKIDILSNNIEEIKKIITQKKADLRMSISIYNFNKENFKEKQIELDKNK
jgi:biotin-(acetyl-CoA carboxylase) ligase